MITLVGVKNYDVQAIGENRFMFAIICYQLPPFGYAA
jgi:hypothetical protein